MKFLYFQVTVPSPMITAVRIYSNAEHLKSTGS